MNEGSQSAVPMPPQTPSMEPHFTVAQVAERWGLSADTVRRLFEQEAGVLVVEAPRSRFSRRRYRTLRIPAAVIDRVHRRLSIVNSSTQIQKRS